MIIKVSKIKLMQFIQNLHKMHSEQESIPLEEIVYKPSIKTDALKPESRTKSHNLYLYLIAGIANLLSFVTGSAISWVSPILPKLDKNGDLEDNPFGRPITALEASWIAGLLPLGATVGPILAGKVADKIGRKQTLLILATLQIISYIITAFAQKVYLYYISRFLNGVALGSIYAILPMFLVEISEIHNRGTLACSMNIFVAVGLNFSLIAGPYLSIRNFFLITVSPLLIFLPCFYFLSPETPSFLASIRNNKALEKSLVKLRSKSVNEIQSEMTNILDAAEHNNQTKGKITDLYNIKSLRKGLITSVGLAILQQCVGVSAIFSYMQTIFESAKIQFSPEICVMIVGTFQIFGTIISTVVVDRAGRRILLLASSVLVCVNLLFLSLYFYLETNKFQVDSIFWLPVLSLILFVVAFGVGLGPVPWVMVSELFPSNFRSTAVSLTSFLCFIVSFIVTVTFPALSIYLGSAKCFLMFAVISFAGSLFIYFVVPETKGKSLQEIQKLLGGG